MTMDTNETQGRAERPSAAADGSATRIVDAVLKELRGRKGFSNWWDSIDSDIQDELLFSLMEKVESVIQPPNADSTTPVRIS